MPDVLQDVRLCWRQLRRSPGFTAAAVLTLGLGIGTATTFFAVVNALLFKPVPAARLDGVHVVRLQNPKTRAPQALPIATFRSLERAPPPDAAAVAAVAGVMGVPAQIPGRVEQVNLEAITGQYARVVDLAAQRGRWLTAADEAPSGAESPIVISDVIWRDWLGADPDAVGRTLRVRGRTGRIVGVAPPLYRGLASLYAGVDVWVPLAHLSSFEENAAAWLDRGGFEMIVRLPPDAPLASTVDAVAARVLAGRPPDVEPVTARLVPMSERLRARQVGPIANMLLAIAGLVLLAACANLANMLYVRGLARAGETAVRMSLGASTARVVRLNIIETLILSMLAAALGLMLAVTGTAALADVLPALTFNRYLRFSLDLSPDYRVLGAAFGAGLVAALVIGLLVSWRTSRVLPARALAPAGAAEGLTGMNTGRLRSVLVSIQVTVALLLTMSTGLFWEQFRETQRRDEVLNYRVNFDADRIVTGRMDLSLHGYHEDSSRHFLEAALPAVTAIDTVDAAAFATALPGGRSPAPRWTMFQQAIDGPVAGLGERVRGAYIAATPEYLDVLGLPILRGRGLMPSDGFGAPAVAVVTEGFAEALWPGADPVGRQMLFAGGGAEPLTVVGLTADPVRSADLTATNPAHFVFLPLAQRHQSAVIVVVRTDAPAAVADPLRTAIRALDDDVAISDVGTVSEVAMAWLQPVRTLTTLMTTVGVMAMAIAMFGVYGVVAFFVARRRREFGIRLALGATPRRVRKLVFDHTLHVMLVGLLPGVWMAASASRWVEARSFELMPNEIRTWVVVPFLVLAAGIVAGGFPAWRASRVDPNRALRDL